LRQRVPTLLKELRLDHGEIRIFGTPRRLVVSVEDLAPRQSDLEQVIKGPPAERAYGPDGEPTKAAEGFARSRGVAVADLQTREIDGGRYVAAVVRQEGLPAAEVLSKAIPGLIESLRFEKSMRWNQTNIAFSRPIRWLLALYGQQIVPFEFAGLQSGNETRGLRFEEPARIVIERPEEYFKKLHDQDIILDVAERQEAVKRQVATLAEQAGGSISPDPALLAEVTNLVEAPVALRGSFDPSHLKLPREVLVAVMKKHQRYFPVEKDGSLLPYFIALRNGDDQGMDLVREGNEQVIRARFADAAYFIREDLKRPLEAYLPDLAKLTFQARLGSMLDKTRRIVELVSDLADQIELDRGELTYARRAAELSKADLATQMVVEMTSLQGIMGRYYALDSGEPEEVALAIFEHYLPRFAGDFTPRTKAGLVVGLADRLDSLTGLFAAGLAPSGNKDPFAQRRAALGLVQNLSAWNLDFDLSQGISAAAVHLPLDVDVETQLAVLNFIIERLRNLLLEDGYRYDVVDAVLEAQGENPAFAARAVQQLAEWVQHPDWNTILPAYSRTVRITRDFEEKFEARPEFLVEPAERTLYEALLTAENTPRAPGSVDDFINAFLPMIPAINRFFDEVLVMIDEQTLRENRLGLLQRIVALADGVADMSRLEGF
jgi:glycyl-tRNA synthetase